MRIFNNLARAVIVAACVTSSSWAANIVLNGGFETGDFTDWIVNGNSDHPWIVDAAPGLSGGSPNSGTYYADTGCVGAQCLSGTAAQQASLAQILGTILGQSYTLTFFFTTNGNGVANELNVLWDGTSVLDLGPGGTLGPIRGYAQYTVSGLVGTGSDTLTFLGRQDPGYNGLDNVAVTGAGGSSATTPEPASLLLFGAGASLIAIRRRRRQEA